MARSIVSGDTIWPAARVAWARSNQARLRGRGGHADLDREDRGLGAIVHAELGQDMRDAVARRLRAQPQRPANLRVRLTYLDLAEHVELAWGERGDACREVDPALGQRFHLLGPEHSRQELLDALLRA